MDNSQKLALDNFVGAVRTGFGNRVVSLAAYGSVVNGRSTASSDVDVFIMLQDYEPRTDDLALLARAVRPHRNVLEFDVSLQYLTEQRDNPKYFQDGTKGCLALAYLSSAEILIGSNIFSELYDRLLTEDLRESVRESVHRYLNMLRMEAISSSDDEHMLARFRKYLSRSLIDAFIFHQKSTMQPYKHMRFNDVIEFAQHNEFTTGISDWDVQKWEPAEYMTVMENLYLKIIRTAEAS